MPKDEKEYSFVGRLPRTKAHSAMDDLFHVPLRKESFSLTRESWQEIRKCAKQDKATLIALDDNPRHHDDRNILYATLDIEYDLLKEFL